MFYICYIDEPLHPVSYMEIIDCTDRAEARRAALRLLAERPKAVTVEIWDDLGRIERIAADTPQRETHEAR
jgi:hypothetical protein